MKQLQKHFILLPNGEMQQIFATTFATSFAKATEVKESFGGQRKLQPSVFDLRLTKSVYKARQNVPPSIMEIIEDIFSMKFKGRDIHKF
jgi:hypothetical protein